MKLAIPVALLVAALSLDAQDWNQWRGPSRTGVTTTFKPPATWPDRPRTIWNARVGTGHASPVVSGGRAFVFSREGEQEVVIAFELASGKQVWRQAYDAPYRMNPAATSHGKGPKSTPLVHGGRVFTLGISGTLTALEAGDGRVAWRKDFAGAYDATSPDYGAAMSPVADGDAVIAHVGGNSSGAITAFDVKTGAIKWSWKGDGPAYTSPIVAPLAGLRQVITQTRARLVGLSAADGRLLWSIPFTTDYDQNVVTPVVLGADSIVYGGLSTPTVAIRVSQAAGTWRTTELWRNADIPMYMSSPIVVGGTLVGLTQRQRGQFFAADPATGKVLWSSPGRQGENAALTAAGDVVIATTTEGQLVVLRRAASGFEEVRRYTVADSPIWAHPALAPGGILIKDAESIAYWTF